MPPRQAEPPVAPDTWRGCRTDAISSATLNTGRAWAFVGGSWHIAGRSWIGGAHHDLATARRDPGGPVPGGGRGRAAGNGGIVRGPVPARSSGGVLRGYPFLHYSLRRTAKGWKRRDAVPRFRSFREQHQWFARRYRRGLMLFRVGAFYEFYRRQKDRALKFFQLAAGQRRTGLGGDVEFAASSPLGRIGYRVARLVPVSMVQGILTGSGHARCPPGGSARCLCRTSSALQFKKQPVAFPSPVCYSE